jgi:hypothetical protein
VKYMEVKNNKGQIVDKVLWSIALPGFGQLLNGKYLKGLLFIFLEFVINVQSNFNQVIKLSFQGEIQEAIRQSNYQWLMFYPCIYLFAIWDAYRDAGGGKSPYSYVQLVVTTYIATIGVIYSDKLKIFGILFGPVWLPILFCMLGLAVGYLIQISLRKWFRSDHVEK